MDQIRTITLHTLKRNGAKAIPDDCAVTLIVNSKPKAVLVPPQEYEMLVRSLEELEDIAAIEARHQEKSVPFERGFPRKSR